MNLTVTIYALYYYDRPLLASWLSHYCQLKTIDEIIIQDQNWSVEDTLFLLKTVALYVDEYKKKIVVLPSPFKRVTEGKRDQFIHYGIPAIMNRGLQFLQNDCWIWGAMDEAIYGDSYADTDERLEAFEKLATSRSEKEKYTVGFLPLYNVVKNGFYLWPAPGTKNPLWKQRLFRFSVPSMCRGENVHDNSVDALVGGNWVCTAPGAGVTTKGFSAWQGIFPVHLKLLHYNTLVRKAYDSVEFVNVRKEEIERVEEHPHYYLHRLVVDPWR